VSSGYQAFLLIIDNFTKFSYTKRKRATWEKISSALRSIIMSGAGVTYAYTARDKGEFDTALKVLESTGKEIGKDVEDSLMIAATLDEERYHLNRATAFLAYPKSKPAHAIAARNELKQASDRSIHSLARHAFSTTLLAKSYLIEGQYPMAVAYTENALTTVFSSNSTMNMARLDAIYQHLKMDHSYGKSTDVALLGTKLLKLQKPELFH